MPGNGNPVPDSTAYFWIDNFSIEEYTLPYEIVPRNYWTEVKEDEGRLKVTSTNVWGEAQKELKLVPGKKYRLRYRLDMGNCTYFHVIVGNPADGSYVYLPETGLAITASGDYAGTFTAAAENLELRFQLPALPTGADTGYFYLDDIYLEEVVAYVPGGEAEGEGGYRYGFNGQEKSTEINGSQNLYTAEFWQYDGRLGRRWNLDPKLTTGLSPYASLNNNPIFYGDPLGDTSIPSADGGSLDLPDDYVSDIRTFDSKETYTVGGKKINPVSGGVLGFKFNDVNYTAQYNTKDQSFAYYLGTDGSKLGYNVNTIPATIQFTGDKRLATAGLLAMTVPRTPGLNRIPPAYLIGYAAAAGAGISSLYHWNNVSNDLQLTKPLPFSLPMPTLPLSIPYTGHGNRLANSNPQMVYQFSFIPKDGRTPILKYGIADMYKSGYGRPEKQMPAMMAMYGASVSWKPITFTPNRISALAAEAALVTSHVAIYDEMPREQKRPIP